MSQISLDEPLIPHSTQTFANKLVVGSDWHILRRRETKSDFLWPTMQKVKKHLTPTWS